VTPYREGKLLAPATFQLGLRHPRLRIGWALCVATVRFAPAVVLLPFLLVVTLAYAKNGEMVSHLGVIAGRFRVFPKLLWATFAVDPLGETLTVTVKRPFRRAEDWTFQKGQIRRIFVEPLEVDQATPDHALIMSGPSYDLTVGVRRNEAELDAERTALVDYLRGARFLGDDVT
jgi:hypothetical protein